MLALVPHTWSPDTIAHMALYRRCPVAYERAMMSQIPYMPKGREPTRAATLLKKVIDRDQQARPSLRDLSLPGAPGACVPCAAASPRSRPVGVSRAVGGAGLRPHLTPRGVSRRRFLSCAPSGSSR